MKLKMLTLHEVSQLTGEKYERVLYQIKHNPELKFSSERIGRSYQIPLPDVLSYMANQGLKPQCDPNSLGRELVPVPAGDRTLNTKQVMEKLGIASRGWFQEALKRGLVPQPYIRRRPDPSLWLESEIEEWLLKEKPKATFQPHHGDVSKVYLGDRCLGIVRKVVSRTVPVRTDGSPTTKIIYGWKPDGYKGKPFKRRVEAADWLQRQKRG